MYLTIWAMAFLNSTGVPRFDSIVGVIRPISNFSPIKDPIYDGCGTTKFCIGSPSNCLTSGTCKAFAATFKKDGKFIFEMRSTSQSAYIASALSFDRHMGEDSAIECVRNGDKVEIFSSYTIRESGTFDAIRYGIPQNIIRLKESRFDNGAIYCQVERDEVSTVNDIEFNLSTGKFYLLLATGSKVKRDRITVHNLGHGISKKTIRYS